MTFPRIECLDDLRKHVQHKPEIRFRDEDHNTTVVCYMISDENTFDDDWARECRGITFCNVTGKVIMRTLHKFHNVGERESTRKENLPMGNVHQIMDKRDGSMISGCERNGRAVVKTKKSFTSDVAIQAQVFVDAPENTKYSDFIKKCSGYNWTPTFEWTTPKMRIVLNYQIDELVLLHVRDNVTGEYLFFNKMAGISDYTNNTEFASVLSRLIAQFDIPVVESKFITHTNPDIDALLKFFETAEGIEGSIIQFQNGDMVKLKTKWYVNLHRAVTFVRERDIALMCINEELDDVKGAMRDLKMTLDPVLIVEAKVKDRWTGIVDGTEELVASKGDMSMKEFAKLNNKHQYFHLAARVINGRNPPYYDYFFRNVLKQEYGLHQILDGTINGFSGDVK